MIIESNNQVDIFVGSRIGSFKHVKFHTDISKNNKKCIENLFDIKSLQKDEAITCMEWGNQDQTEILIGKKNQQIQIYNTVEDRVTASYSADFGSGHVVGLGRCRRRLLAATAGGMVRVWSKKVDLLIPTGGKLDVMKVFNEDPTIFATGGEENDLKIWQIGSPEPTFRAKNLPHDWLQLRRGVWVSGLALLPGGGGHLAAVCSRHGYVRLYDARAQRRPVVNVDFEKMAATCIVPGFDDRQLLVGFGRGQLHQVDLRMGKPDKGYKDAAGAITSIATARGRLVVSAALDRHIRLHRHASKELLHRQYLTSKLTSVLVQTETSTPLRGADDVKEEDIKEEDVPDDLDAIFDTMETIEEKSHTSKILSDVPPSKKLKPSTEGSTGATEDSIVATEDSIEATEDSIEATEDSIEATEDSAAVTEDAIAQLLRSTEKLKRKRDKKKRQKKAKSVFHNA